MFKLSLGTISIIWVSFMLLMGAFPSQASHPPFIAWEATMKQIPLTQGKFALVDDEDFDWLNLWKCQSIKKGGGYYAERTFGYPTKTHIKMHRLLLGLKKGDGISTDHIDRNSLNNQRSNLRKCTNTQNRWNVKVTNSKLGLQGVVLSCRKLIRFHVRVFCERKYYHGGAWGSVSEAVRYRNCMARILHGEFAYIVPEIKNAKSN